MSLLKYSFKYFSPLLLVCFLAPSFSFGQSLARLQNDIKAAASYDYCAWHFDQNGDPSELDYFKNILEKDGFLEEEYSISVYVTGGAKVAQNSTDKESCKKIFIKGKEKYNKSFTKIHKQHRKRAKFKKSKDEQIFAVQDSLSDFWVEDQARRRSYIDMTTEYTVGVDYWARRISVAETSQTDGLATAYMKELITRYDWIDSHRFGDKISAHAWILVQHADDHPSFQAEVLERMEKYVDNGGVSKSNYAYLYDRVAVNHDRLQRYGTQPTWECTDTGLVLAPLEDPENVNKRRKEMGMDTVEEQLAEMSRSVCG